MPLLLVCSPLRTNLTERAQHRARGARGMDAMIGQLLGLALLGGITYLLLRLRDFLLELGQDSRFGFPADRQGVGGRLKLRVVRSWRSRKDGGSIA